jgi:hypothetical protein
VSECGRKDDIMRTRWTLWLLLVTCAIAANAHAEPPSAVKAGQSYRFVGNFPPLTAEVLSVDGCWARIRITDVEGPSADFSGEQHLNLCTVSLIAPTKRKARE